MKTKQIIEEIANLPVKQRAKIADQILQTLNRSHPEIEKAWVEEAKRRLKEFDEGNVKAISGGQVHRELREKYE